MNKKIFKGILWVSLLTLLLSIVFIVGIQFQLYSERQETALESEAGLVKLSLENGTDISAYKDVSQRITLIDKSGKVLFDNKADISEMSNHFNRSEIKSALKNGTGSAVRSSETLFERTVYYAVLLEDGNILRIADTRVSVVTVLIKLSPALCAICVFTFVIAIILASIISKKITNPLNALNIENPAIEQDYTELAPLFSKLRAQNRKINLQIAELTQSKREFEVISENMSEGMLLTDNDGIILTHNKSIERIFEKNTEINKYSLLSLNNSKEFRNVFNHIITALRYETLFPLNGRCYEIIENPVFDENSLPCGAVVLAIDVTEREERERLRREFTANVSHELKTPLTSILGISDMLKSGIVQSEDIKSFSEDINKETKRLISLVNDIIRLSQLDEGINDYTNESVDLKEIAGEVAGKLKSIADTRDIKLNLEGSSAIINAPETLIFELVYNLCDNAVKYNRPSGSVTITTGYKNGAFIKVKDTGIGISKEHTDKIFERFYRVDKSRSKQDGGTGLGLSIVKHIAICTGGKISVESTVGTGTEITVIWDLGK